jgi:thiamine kinase-like enzyme
VDPLAAAERVWPGRKAHLEELGGGITNRNYKVTVDGEAFVLRVGGKDTELLGIDREVEHAASRAAASVGVGPEVVAFLEPEGWLVTRFVEGRPVPVEEMQTPLGVARAVAAIRPFHDGGAVPGRFDAFRVVEAYRQTAGGHGVTVPDDYSWAKARADEIEAALGERDQRPCHNDLLNANFIDDGERLRIVDWEYAGMGDPFFDLANFSVNHELDEAGNEELLRAYFGEARSRDLAALRLMRFMSDFREAMWGVVQQGISELDFDFAGYAAQHFARLRKTAEAPEFRRALRGSRA